jgi:hypothetical protein
MDKYKNFCFGNKTESIGINVLTLIFLLSSELLSLIVYYIFGICIES